MWKVAAGGVSLSVGEAEAVGDALEVSEDVTADGLDRDVVGAGVEVGAQCGRGDIGRGVRGDGVDEFVRAAADERGVVEPEPLQRARVIVEAEVSREVGPRGLARGVGVGCE